MGIMLTIGGMHIHDDVFERCGHFLIVFAGASSMYAMVNYYAIEEVAETRRARVS